MHDYIAVPRNYHLKSGMDLTQPLNHLFYYKPDYKVWMNAFNT
jgi:hypothetical protein